MNIDWQFLVSLPIIALAAMAMGRRLMSAGNQSGCAGCTKSCQENNELINLK